MRFTKRLRLGNTFFCLDRHKEAIRAYKKYIKLADKQKDTRFINNAKMMIAVLKTAKRGRIARWFSSLKERVGNFLGISD